MSEGSDESLFAAYCQGDRAAFELLFQRYQDPLCRHLERMLSDWALAEDLVVETFLRLHRPRPLLPALAHHRRISQWGV